MRPTTSTIVSFIFISLLFVSPAGAQSFLPVYERGYADFEVDLIIGGDIDDEESYVISPIDMALDSKRHLFVLDYRGFCIKKFDSSGKCLATFGRKGEGPGEMMSGFKIAVDPNDNVVLYDLSLRRFSFFDNAGNFVNSVSFGELGLKLVTKFAFDDTGKLYVKTEESQYGPTRRTTVVSIERWSLSPFEETVIESEEIHKNYTKYREGGSVTVTAPFYSDIFWSAVPTGNIVTVNSADYRVRIYSPELELVVDRQIECERRIVTSEDKEEYFEGFGEGPDQIWMRQMIEFPKFKPHFSQLNVDDEGYILLDRDEFEGGDGHYHVLTPDGNFMGKVRLPRLKRSSILKNGMIYTLELHEDTDYAVYRYVQK